MVTNKRLVYLISETNPYTSIPDYTRIEFNIPKLKKLNEKYTTCLFYDDGENRIYAFLYISKKTFRPIGLFSSSSIARSCSGLFKDHFCILFWRKWNSDSMRVF
jgi:hypothetical protein